MYKRSTVIYKLADNTVVRTLKEAKASGQTFTKDYEPIYEEFPLTDEVKARRRKI